MTHIILKNIDLNKIYMKDTYSSYKLYYNDIFNICGIPIKCNGEIINDKINYKFYIDSKSYSLLYSIQNNFKSKLHDYQGFINSDEKGNYICFPNVYHLNDKLNKNTTEFYLNIKYINKHNYNTIIHII